LIWRGGQRTRRKEKIEQILRIALAIEQEEKHNISHESTQNVSTDSPDTPLRRTGIAVTNDLTAFSEINDSSVIAISLVSPAVVEEMTTPTLK
jgi:hypothetical protein